MLVSFNWLKQFVNLPDSTSAEEVARKLTMSAVEVEEVRKLGENLEGRQSFHVTHSIASERCLSHAAIKADATVM